MDEHVNISTAKSKATLTTYDIVMVALFTALTASGAFIKIPIPGIPFTLQYLFTMLSGILLGTKKGTLSVFCYVFLGLIGVPIFAAGGGPSYVLQPTFGYLIGFIAATFVTGLVVHKVSEPTFSRILFANFIGLFIVYGLGMLYFYLISTLYLQNEPTAKTIFVSCFLLFVPGDSLSCILAAFLGNRLIPILHKEGYIK